MHGKENIKRNDILNEIYPIGSYYETSDLTFNPNNSWVGTWDLEQDGTVLASRAVDVDSILNSDVGEIVGEHQHQLMLDEVPDQLISGYCAEDKKSWAAGYWYDYSTYNYPINSVQYSGIANGNKPHNIIQPTKIVNRWHRVA